MAGAPGSAVDVTQFQGFVCVSGDGMVYECLQGIMSRPDRERVLRIPMGHIPAGTSNALASTLGARDPVTAALLIARCESRPIDLLRVRNGTQTNLCVPLPCTQTTHDRERES
jgi:sphingosine kinase